MGALQYVLLLTAGSLCALSCGVQGECVKTGPCSCKNTDGSGTVDLSPLDGHDAARFFDIMPMEDIYYYSWNPCTSFSENASCSDVSGCKLYHDVGLPLGTQDTAAFVTDSESGKLALQYSSTDSAGTRFLTVDLVCNPKSDPGDLYIRGEMALRNYSMILTSMHCCPKPDPTGAAGAFLPSLATVSLSVTFTLCLVGRIIFQ